MVSHSSPMLKMCTIDLPDQNYNWVVNYFNQRGHIRSHRGIMSSLAMINASVIQSSVLGPPSVIVEASDLHPFHTFNALMKYADDSYLLVGSRHISTASEEFDHITDWSGKNNLRLNPSKPRELIVFRRGGHVRSQLPTSPIICGAERVDSLRVLGVVITHDLSMTAHLDQALSSCASSICALRVLRSHGLCPQLVHRVAKATAVASLMYASPAWWGFSSAR